MYREIINELNKWKNKIYRKPLILTGVRQCGKTYIVREFGRNSFQDYVYINFEQNDKAAAVFDYDFDIERILKELSRLAKKEIVPGKTLVFFDEIQEAPRAITSLKYFCENLRKLHLICAGSLLGVALKQEQISFPVGKVNRMQLYPMSFKEFVIACGREDLIDTFENWSVDRVIPELYSEPMKKLLDDYYIVGGMPEVVNIWLETRDYDEVRGVQNEIIKDYADDFSKHAPASEIPKIRWVWDSIPVQLAKENNKFVFSHVKKGMRAAELEDALNWLENSGQISMLHMVENPEIPLSGFADKTYFKVYMSDIGLLGAKMRVLPENILDGTGLSGRYKGAIAENYVMNELKVSGIEPYFWRSGNSAEIDFIYESADGIIPVEVKAADNTQAKSYKQFCRRFKPVSGYKLSRKNIAENMCEETRTKSIPLYLAWRIQSDDPL